MAPVAPNAPNGARPGSPAAVSASEVEVKGQGCMPSDGLKAFRLRQTSSGGRKPAPGPDIEAKILDAAECVFGHFGVRGVKTALSGPRWPSVRTCARPRSKTSRPLRWRKVRIAGGHAPDNYGVLGNKISL